MATILVPSRHEMEQVLVRKQAELGEKFGALRADAGQGSKRNAGGRGVRRHERMILRAISHGANR
jgi:hypothetical protein